MEYKKAIIYGLAFKCPLGNRIPGCPFLEIEQFLNKEKMQWINKLSAEEIKNIISHHKACSQIDWEAWSFILNSINIK